jgi:hypothetical protein
MIRSRVPVIAAQDRRSLRKTGLIHAPQHSQPTNELCQYPPSLMLRRTSPKPAAEADTSHGFAPDLQSRTAPVPRAQSREPKA